MSNPRSLEAPLLRSSQRQAQPTTPARPNGAQRLSEMAVAAGAAL